MAMSSSLLLQGVGLCFCPALYIRCHRAHESVGNPPLPPYLLPSLHSPRARSGQTVVIMAAQSYIVEVHGKTCELNFRPRNGACRTLPLTAALVILARRGHRALGPARPLPPLRWWWLARGVRGLHAHATHVHVGCAFRKSSANDQSERRRCPTRFPHQFNIDLPLNLNLEHACVQSRTLERRRGGPRSRPCY